jgi:hypothetical protein
MRSLRVICSTYPQANHGEFACSDQMLERIWRVSARTLELCSEDVYTDCPTYEQVSWVGDSRNESLVDLVVNGDPRLSEHTWFLAARSLERSPLVESHVPSGWRNLLPAWSFLWMRWADEHFRFTRDVSFAKSALPWLKRNVHGIASHINSKNLFQIHAWNMFDWAPMDTPRDAMAITHLNCLAVLALNQCQAIARAVGDREAVRQWRQLAIRIKNAVNQHLWNAEHRAYVDCIRRDGSASGVLSQQTQTVAYLSGVAEADRRVRCRDIIDKPPKDFVGAGSPFFMCFKLEALSEQGRWADVLDDIRHYWGSQIDAGATTFWELYHPHEARVTRSHCHGWSSAPAYFLSRGILGVPLAQDEPGTLRVAPGIGDLNWAAGRVPTSCGQVSIRWTKADSTLKLCVSSAEKSQYLIDLQNSDFACGRELSCSKANRSIRKIAPRMWLTQEPCKNFECEMRF